MLLPPPRDRRLIRRRVLAGGAGNYFKSGRYLDFQNKFTFADMLASCFHYMGYADIQKFGDDRLNDGTPLAGLTA